jgi:hypothetical protein
LPVDDRAAYRVYVRDAATNLLISDGLVYRGVRGAARQVRTIRRVLGVEAEYRPMS